MDYDGLPKEERDRVFQLYTAQAGSFRRSLNVLLITSAVVFALFVVPFLGFSVQLATVKESAAIAEDRRLNNEERLAELQPDLEAMGELRRLLHDYGNHMRSIATYQDWEAEGRALVPDILALRAAYRDHSDADLRAWAIGRHATLNPAVYSRVRSVNSDVRHECEWRLDDDRQSLNAYVACRTCDGFRGLDNRVGSRISRVVSSSFLDMTTVVAPAQLTDIVDRACGFLLDGDIHWHTGTPLAPDTNRIRASFTHDVGAYHAKLEDVQASLAAQLSRRNEATAALVAELETTREEEAALLLELEALSKFDRLATPFGDVPITLNQLALLFPIAVAIGFLMVATNFGQMVRLRQEFARLSGQFDTEAQVIRPAYLDAIAPVWLGPRTPLMTRVIKWLILLIPLALILTTYAMIQQSGTFAEPFPEGSAISSVAYYVLYALSLALVVGGLAHIWLAARLSAD